MNAPRLIIAFVISFLVCALLAALEHNDKRRAIRAGAEWEGDES